MITICKNLNTEPNLFDEKDYDAELDALIDRMYKAGESESETAPPHDYDDEEDENAWAEEWEKSIEDNAEDDGIDYSDDDDEEDDDDYLDQLLRDFVNSAEEDAKRRREETSYEEDIAQNMNTNVKVRILRPIDNPQEELKKLVGCSGIKRRLKELVALTKYNHLVSKHYPESKQHTVSLHSIFFGSPGTGKTTLCKIFGSLMHEVGALSRGHVVVCDRSTFIGDLWGDEERAMTQVLEKAQGGVLMLDEAYLFNGKNKNDPGKLVIQLLMNTLADETQRDIAIVLCGYKDEMMQLLELNPGLESRLPNRFEFTDFNVNELLEITQRRVKEYDYHFTKMAWEKYIQVLSQAYQERDPKTWGNARFVANQLERIYIKHAQRCVTGVLVDMTELHRIRPEDIQPLEVPKPRPKIGF